MFFKNIIIILYFYFSITVLSLTSKKEFISNNLNKINYSFNKNILDELYLENQNRLRYMNNSNIVSYWGINTRLTFDRATTSNIIYNNTYRVYNKKRLQFNLNPVSALQFVTITNTTWLVMRTNHFYKYYDYIDINRLSINQT